MKQKIKRRQFIVGTMGISCCSLALGNSIFSENRDSRKEVPYISCGKIGSVNLQKYYVK
jgi:hypothetical protein